MSIIVNFTDAGEARRDRSALVKLRSGEQCLITVAAGRVIVRKTGIGFLAKTLYDEADAAKIAATAESLAGRYPRSLLPPGLVHPVLCAFTNAVLHCPGAAEVATVLNMAPKPRPKLSATGLSPADAIKLEPGEDDDDGQVQAALIALFGRPERDWRFVSQTVREHEGRKLEVFNVTVGVFDERKQVFFDVSGWEEEPAAAPAAAPAPVEAPRPAGPLTAEDIARANDTAFASSLAVRYRNNTTAQRATADYNIIWGYSQSDEKSDEGAWSTPTVTTHGNVMLGRGTRPRSMARLTDPDISVFEPVDEEEFHPLASVNQSAVDGRETPLCTGGFEKVTGAVFHYTENKNDSGVTFTAPTGVMHEFVDGRLVSTEVGGPGQPEFDLTHIFSAGMCVWFTNVTQTTTRFGVINTMSLLRITSVSANRIDVNGLNMGYAGKSATPISIYATNNGGVIGEDPNVGFAEDLSALMKDQNTAALGVFAVMIGSVSGTTIAELSPNATPNLFNRVIDGTDRFVRLAEKTGKTTSVIAINWSQGGSDLAGKKQMTQHEYMERLRLIHTSFDRRLREITGQTRPLLFMMMQVSTFDLFSNDFGNNAVPMAQLIYGTTAPNAVMIGPTYFVPNLGLHGSPNGYRMRAAMRAKLWHRMMVQGQGWLPLHPISWSTSGQDFMINFHVTVPPLQFRPSFKYCAPSVHKDAGIQWNDTEGTIAVTSVRISGSCTITGTLERAPVDRPAQITPQIASAGKHVGFSNIYDSDPAVSYMSWLYNDFSGQPPIENVPDFKDDVLTGKILPSPVGRPYELFNACCVFNGAALGGGGVEA